MRDTISQGDILKVEKIKLPVLVVSKDFFNQSSEIIACPIFPNGKAGPLHILIESPSVKGCVHCEKVTLLDLNVRSHIRIDRIPLSDIINITDAIQGIFDYV